MKNVSTVIFISTVLFIASCTKVQLALNKLEGKWKSIEYNDNGTILPAGTFDFYWVFPDCKAKNEQHCKLEMLDQNGILTDTEHYRISKDVKWFLMWNETLQKDDSLELLTLTKDRLIIKTSAPNGYYTIMTLAKQ